MKNYLRWGLRQLYLLYFLPTRFRREVKDDGIEQFRQRLNKPIRYFLGMLPWIVILVVIGNLITGYVCESLGILFNWERSWRGVAIGGAVMAAVSVALSVTGAAATSAMVSVTGILAAGVWTGAAFIVEGNATYDATYGMAYSVVYGTLGGAMVGTMLGVVGASAPGSVGRGTALGLWGLLIGGLATGAVYGAARGAVHGIATGATFGVAFFLVYFRLVTYPFEFALSTVTYFAGRWRSRAVARAWRWCPVAWNEVIWLPLPFAGKLLALLTKQDREEGFRQITFVAAERRLQRRVAVAALAEAAVADLKAESLSQLADVTERLNWTTDAPAELAEEIVTALPRFDRVAQHVGQYLTLNSSYRKREALTRSVEETESLQRSLIVTRGRNAPRLLQVANGWRRLLDEESERVKSLPEAAREIPNPFVYGNAVVETEYNVFTGRRDVVRQIEASLLGAAQAPTLLLQGPRRMGKTSILNQLPRLLGPDFAPAVVDCQNPAVTGSEATLLRYLSRALSEGLRRRRVSVEELKAQQLAREPYAVFDEWLEKVERAMPAGMRALLCLDEYERLQSALEAGWGAPFLDSLRHTFQHRPRVVLMFTGAHTFQELGPAWTDRFISARRMRVSFLGREDVELLLTKPIPEFDMTYAAGALDAMVAATSCHPFLTQAVAFELVQLMNERERREATTADVEEAVGRALVSGDAYFVNVWGDAGAEGQAILRALAAGEPPPDFPGARAWLREHDVLGADGDFAVEMMRRWVVSRATAV